MSNVSEWSVTPASNNNAPPDGAPEQMLPGKVNDCLREMMSSLAKWYKDQNASLQTAGSQPAYTLSTNSTYTALSDIPLLVFRVHAGNTGACTLNVDSLGAKPLRKSGDGDDYASGDLTTGQALTVVYNPTSDDFETVGPPAPVAEVFASGTVMLFAQTAAPTGWTKNVSTGDNSAIRLTTGTASTGGASGFTSVFTSRTILQANLPAASLTHSLAAATHTHAAGSYAVGTSINNGTGVARNINLDTQNYDQPGGAQAVQDVNFTESTLSLASGAVSGTSGASGSLAVTGTVSLGGSGTAVDFAVQYVDVIRATKD